jgi:hypothetical protein
LTNDIAKVKARNHELEIEQKKAKEEVEGLISRRTGQLQIEINSLTQELEKEKQRAVTVATPFNCLNNLLKNDVKNKPTNNRYVTIPRNYFLFFLL